MQMCIVCWVWVAEVWSMSLNSNSVWLYVFLFSSLHLTEQILRLQRLEVNPDLCSQSFHFGFLPENNFRMLNCFFLFFPSKAIEKSVVPWVNDQDVPFCPDCGNKFSIRNRRHHCRLCGSIMCKKCMELIGLPLASRWCGCGPWTPISFGISECG